MIKIILGIIAGFIVWSIVWVGGDATLANFSPDWYQKHRSAAELAIENGTTISSGALISVVNLGRSFLTSILAGYMAALVAGEYKKSTMILGIILVAVGIVVEYLMWNVAPVWYHVLFVLFLLPMTTLGGRLRRSN